MPFPTMMSRMTTTTITAIKTFFISSPVLLYQYINFGMCMKIPAFAGMTIKACGDDKVIVNVTGSYPTTKDLS